MMVEPTIDGEIMCPYCGYTHCPEPEDYDESKLADFECGRCEKVFEVMCEISVSFIAYPKPEVASGE